MSEKETAEMSVREILVEWLKAHDYDGLWNTDDCVCALEDLMPCGGSEIGCCVPAVKIPCDGRACEGRCDYHMLAARHREPRPEDLFPGGER